MKNQEPRLGIDIGRVLISAGQPGSKEDTSFISGSLEDALRTPPMAGAFDAIPALVERFEGRVWLVSKCGARVQKRSEQWLEEHRFFEITGIPRVNLRFCLKRHQKAGHCADLGITHFIDDRVDVLTHLRGLVPHLFLFGPQRDPDAPALAWLEHLPHWDRALDQVQLAS